MSAAVVAMLVLLGGAGVRGARSVGSAAATRSRFEHRLFRRPAGVWGRPPEMLVRWAAPVGASRDVLESMWPAAVVLPITVLVASGALLGLAGVLVAGALMVAIPVAAAGRRAAGVRRRRARALPVLLEDVARGLRSGASLRQALELSLERADATLRPELHVVCDTVANGGSLEVALDGWCQRQPCEGLSLAVAALTLGIDAGGAHGRALDGVAASLRDRLAMDRELAALTSQARASAGVMAVAPVLFAAFAASADRRTAHALVGTRTGLACLAGGLVLDGIAAFWMWRLTGAQR